MAHIPKQQRAKFDRKSTNCILVGYASNAKAFRLYDIKNRKINVSCDVVFFENQAADTSQVISISDSNINQYVFDSDPKQI